VHTRQDQLMFKSTNMSLTLTKLCGYVFCSALPNFHSLQYMHLAYFTSLGVGHPLCKLIQMQNKLLLLILAYYHGIINVFYYFVFAYCSFPLLVAMLSDLLVFG